MRTLVPVAIFAVAGFHAWFLILEMFLWKKPYGQKTFGMTPEVAESTAVLAANQGLYNGFLAAGLVWATVCGFDAAIYFFLGCVVIAGVFGALTVNKKIFWVQAAPALVAGGLLFFA